jgi:hypothetical protein
MNKIFSPIFENSRGIPRNSCPCDVCMKGLRLVKESDEVPTRPVRSIPVHDLERSPVRLVPRIQLAS